VVAGLIALTIGTGFVAARIFGRQWRFALLTGGAVAICGASATLAIAAIIPHNDKTERNVLFTVVSVTTLSTVAMVLYPPCSRRWACRGARDRLPARRDDPRRGAGGGGGLFGVGPGGRRGDGGQAPAGGAAAGGADGWWCWSCGRRARARAAGCR
jgi:hypothetical protein